MAQPNILIVGGGPTGLISALCLHAQGVPFRLIDAAAGPGAASRATGVHARTLELYRPFGLDKVAIEHGVHTLDARIRTLGFGGKPYQVATIPFSKFGTGVSAYPYIHILPQDVHEEILDKHLRSLGVNIERSTVLTSLVEEADGIHVEITGPKGVEHEVYKYVLGADGAHSKVRKAIAVGFAGGTYMRHFYCADTKTDDPFGSHMIVTVSAGGVNIRMPARQGNSTRLIGLVPAGVQPSQATFEDVREDAEKLLDAKVSDVHWFSHYNVHHRVADHYRVGNCFLMGDSAHLHSPMGGQGMNTGIGDAINLTWKLAQVEQGRLAPEVLDSYEAERRPFGVKLVETTDKAFGLITASTFFGAVLRQFLWPLMMAIITRSSFVRAKMFRFVSQVHICYDGSSLSEGIVGSVKGGDRLPWVDWGDRDNFQEFDGVNWQLHVYGEAAVELEELKWLKVVRWPCDKMAKQKGFKNGAVYLTRPDSYTALVMPRFDLGVLRQYMSKHGVRA